MMAQEYFLYDPVNPLAPTLVSFLQHGRSMDYFRLVWPSRRLITVAEARVMQGPV